MANADLHGSTPNTISVHCPIFADKMLSFWPPCAIAFSFDLLNVSSPVLSPTISTDVNVPPLSPIFRHIYKVRMDWSCVHGRVQEL